jgi:hypothetical protein
MKIWSRTNFGALILSLDDGKSFHITTILSFPFLCLPQDTLHTWLLDEIYIQKLILFLFIVQVNDEMHVIFGYNNFEGYVFTSQIFSFGMR